MLVENLVRRAEIVRTIRSFFDEQGFVEVETPVRIAAPAPEPHIDCPLAPIPPPLETSKPPNLQTSQTSYLRASPELQMKKLLAYGMDKIYQIGPCFREGECGSRHNPEFSMLEWYRKDATYLDIMEDVERLFGSLEVWTFGRLGVWTFGRLGVMNKNFQTSKLPNLKTANFTRLTVREAYRKFAGWDPWTDWDQDRFDFDMAEKIEPNLPKEPTFLIDYPPQACSLAKVRGEIGERGEMVRVAERWELYWQGIELANCFTELCDGEEQRRRFAEAKAVRCELGESDYPIDEEFLDLLPLIGSAAGVALGVDRLVMLLCGEKAISAVMAK